MNSDLSIQYSGVFEAVGTDIQYLRRRLINFKDVGEGIFIKGPIKEAIVLQVIFYLKF